MLDAVKVYQLSKHFHTVSQYEVFCEGCGFFFKVRFTIPPFSVHLLIAI